MASRYKGAGRAAARSSIRVPVKLTDDSVARAAVGNPEPCTFYNVARGCKFGDKCKNLHVCKHFYLYDSCSFAEKCKRSHEIYDDQPRRVLQEAGINVARHPKDVLVELRARLPSMHVKDDQDGLDLDSPDLRICQYFLRGTCSYRSRCKNLHRETPYQWQYRANGAWQDFCPKSNTEIEKDFCDVLKNYCYTEMEADPGTSKKSFAIVDFEKSLATTNGMKFSVHRITTESAVKSPPGHKYTTRWLWFWQDEDSTWKQYGKNRESISSDDIEEQFLTDENRGITFTAGRFNYLIVYRGLRMIQINKTTRKVRMIRRRPEEFYTGSETLPTQNRSSRQAKSESREKPQPAVNIPSHWDNNKQGDNDFFQLSTLEKTGPTSVEYGKIARLFAATMGSTPIKKIQRIQNPSTWESYCWKKRQMERSLPPGQLVKELRLFHGTRDKYVVAICQQRIDFRCYGRSTGTLYGRGSYFAVEASLAKEFAANSNYLFVVRVLVGESTMGSPDLIRPPAKDPSTPASMLYDSCVDSMYNPSMYVVFDNNQAYPEYLITF